MDNLDAFLSFCRLNLSGPLYEAVGRAYVEVMSPGMRAMFEAAGETPMDKTRLVFRKYVEEHGGNWDDVRGLMLDHEGKKVPVGDYFELMVRALIQKVGRTGRSVRGSMDQGALDRYSARESSRQANAMLGYEPGLARIVLEIGGLGAILDPEALGKLMERKGAPKYETPMMGKGEVERFVTRTFPMFIRHFSDRYGRDEWSDRILPGGMGSPDSGLVCRDRDGHPVELGYGDVVSLTRGAGDLPDPGVGDPSEDAEPVTVGDGLSSKYDIYYVPTTPALEKLCASYDPPVKYYELSYLQINWSDAPHAPWCHSWEWSVERNESAFYVLLWKDWAGIHREMAAADELSERNVTNRYRLSAIAFNIKRDLTLEDGCDRLDQNMLVLTSDTRNPATAPDAIARLTGVKVEDLHRAFPVLSREERLKLGDNCLKNNTVVGVNPAIGMDRTEQVAQGRTEEELSAARVAEANRVLAGSDSFPSRIGDYIRRSPSLYHNPKLGTAVSMMRNAGHRVATYRLSAGDYLPGDTPWIMATDISGGRLSVLYGMEFLPDRMYLLMRRDDDGSARYLVNLRGTDYRQVIFDPETLGVVKVLHDRGEIPLGYMLPGVDSSYVEPEMDEPVVCGRVPGQDGNQVTVRMSPDMYGRYAFAPSRAIRLEGGGIAAYGTMESVDNGDLGPAVCMLGESNEVQEDSWYLVDIVLGSTFICSPGENGGGYVAVHWDTGAVEYGLDGVRRAPMSLYGADARILVTRGQDVAVYGRDGQIIYSGPAKVPEDDAE